MHTKIDTVRTGLVLGGVMAVWHFFWSVLVAAGLAQPVIDFVFWMHFIKPVYVVESFAIGRAAILVVVTGVLGFSVGAVAALLWNSLRRP